MQAKIYTFHSFFLLASLWAAVRSSYHLLAIEHFQTEPNRFILRSSAPFTFNGVKETTIDLFDQEIKLRLKAGFAFRYKFPPKTDSVQFYFDTSCAFPLIFKERDAEFAFKKLDDKSATVNAQMLMLKDFGDRNDFFNGGTYSSAPKDYAKIANIFLSQFISFRPVVKPDPNHLVVFCPFFVDDKDTFQLKIIAKHVKDRINKKIQVRTNANGNYYFKDVIEVTYGGKTTLSFPFANFNGTIWFNSTTNEKSAINLAYSSKSEKIAVQYVSFTYPLRTASNLSIELENFTQASFAIAVEIEGVDEPNQTSSPSESKDVSTHQSADTIFEIGFALAVCGLFITIAIHYKCQMVLTEEVAAEQGLGSLRQLTVHETDQSSAAIGPPETEFSFVSHTDQKVDNSFHNLSSREPESVNMSNSEIILLKQRKN